MQSDKWRQINGIIIHATSSLDAPNSADEQLLLTQRSLKLIVDTVPLFWLKDFKDISITFENPRVLFPTIFSMSAYPTNDKHQHQNTQERRPTAKWKYGKPKTH